MSDKKYKYIVISILSAMLIVFIISAINIYTFINKAIITLDNVDSVVTECEDKLNSLDIDQINRSVEKSSKLIDNIDSVIEKTDGLIDSMDEAMVKTNEMLDTVSEFTDSIYSVKVEVDNMKSTVEGISNNLNKVKNFFK